LEKEIPQIGFNADPGPSFYLNAYPDTGMQGANPMRIHVDPYKTFK
jgi:hypothetical protein